MAVFNAEYIRIRNLFEVQLDSKRQLIDGSENILKSFVV